MSEHGKGTAIWMFKRLLASGAYAFCCACVLDFLHPPFHLKGFFEAGMWFPATLVLITAFFRAMDS